MPLMYDVIALLIEDESKTIELLEPVLAVCCHAGYHYLGVCCLSNGDLMVKVLATVERMKFFRPIDEIIEVDRKATWFTKFLLMYSTIGTISYSLMPILPSALRDCRNNLTPSMIKYGIPCGLACRVRIPFSMYMNEKVLKVIWAVSYFHQIYLIFCVTCLFVTLTMLICSVVMQCVYHYRELRKLMLSIDDNNGDQKLLHRSIHYHSAIIRLCEDVNEAFGTQMTMFIVVPSFAISLLGFVLLIVGFTDRIRFGLHLLGWIAMLLLVNFGGQVLMDESIAVAETAYAIKWYEYKVSFQKDLFMVIMRSQKPQFLNASNIKNLSFNTFLAWVGMGRGRE
ncbi:odorant receptor 67a-like [Atheta coriaria]|uniref:odorant receptor 67a-like n=1 Tax=Dalotia coriaria TaxID=877792 RepID=UPI0031F4494F